MNETGRFSLGDTLKEAVVTLIIAKIFALFTYIND